MAQRLVFTGRQQVHLEDFDPAPLQDGQVLVQTANTLMSTGTENIVFNRLFEPGTGWDNWVKYPFYPGYLCIGNVVAVAPDVTDRKVGDRVALRSGHASHHVRAASETFPVPAGIPSQAAAWFGLAKIAFMGAKVSGYQLGDSLLVIGAGPIGQMTVRWASAAGVARVIVVDPVEKRLALAKRGGATDIIAKPVTECRADVEAAMGGGLPRVVNDSTGNATVFESVCRLAAKYGRIVILGDTGTPSGQHLTQDVINRGLTIVGAHDCHTDGQWNDATITALLFDLVQRGKFDLDALTSHVFKPADYEKAYEIANTRRGETMGIVFDWA